MRKEAFKYFYGKSRNWSLRTFAAKIKGFTTIQNILLTTAQKNLLLTAREDYDNLIIL